MATTRFVGPENNDTPLTQGVLETFNVDYVEQSQITSAIDNALADKADGTYVNNNTTDKITETEVVSRGAGLLAKSSAGQSYGPAALESGRVSNARMPEIAGGVPWRFLGNPTSWSFVNNMTGVIGSAQQSMIGSWTLPNLGYSYYPIFMGTCELGYPTGAELNIRMGSTNGPIFARAVSGNTANYDGISVQPAPAVSAINGGTFYIVAGVKFSGRVSRVGEFQSIGCYAVPA